MEKSPGLAPENVMAPIFKFTAPVFEIEKILVTPPATDVVPKSVKSIIEGEVSPVTIEFPFPNISISGAEIAFPLIAYT